MMYRIYRSTILSFILFAGILFCPTVGKGQSIDELLRIYFSEVRAGKYPAIPKQLSLSENSKAVLGLLSGYQQDSITFVRSKAYTLIQLAGNNSRQDNLREVAVSRLVEGAADKDSGNAGIALDYLTSFRQQDFNPVSKDSIRALFKRKSSHFEKLVKLCGFLGMTDLKEEIRAFTQVGNNQSIRWASLVSLTRMGDVTATNELVRRARKLPVNDDVIYSVFPDLVYTRNREAIDYMIEVLQRDDANCMSADAEREAAIPCGYRVMEQLAPIVKGYPLQLDASGDVKTNDYVAALKTVREWFGKHAKYEILTDRY